MLGLARLGIGLTAFLLGTIHAAVASEEPWHRVLVRVEPAGLGRRPRDERPAAFRLEASEFAPGRRFDLSSIEVLRVDPQGERALSSPLPHRWYDDAIPYQFPECEQNIHSTDGVSLKYQVHPRWGDFDNVLGDGLGGQLVWSHTQEGMEPSHYRINLRMLAVGKSPDRMPARGMIGDGGQRCASRGSGTTGMIHTRVSVADWDGDGLLDLVVGGGRGHVLIYPNRGTRSAPRFPYARYVGLDDGRPLDVGWSSAPLVVDWDRDGTLDLLCGAERNRALVFRGLPGTRPPTLTNLGFLKVDGRPLELPVSPVPKAPPGVFTLDYYPILESADWNGDGRLDLLAGGYITGRIYWLENVGDDPRGRPILRDRGPLFADGKPLNVGDWAAAPCAFDFDDDGDLDLVAGNMPISAGGGDASDRDHFLRYFENRGSRSVAQLYQRPFPAGGRLPDAVLGTPRAADMNGDGLADLVVSAGENIWIFRNDGTRHRPRFVVDVPPIPGEWGSLPLPTSGLQFLDWDGDGVRDMLSLLTLYRGRSGRSGEFAAEPLLRVDNAISHPTPRGDTYAFTQLVDLDGDGLLDLLYGTHEGNIWLHRNLGGRTPRFHLVGERMVTEDGSPIRVGPRPEQGLDFDVLQGARTTFAAGDLDSDGLIDLVVGDTYGKVRYFQNLGPVGAPRFRLSREIADLKIRLQPFVSDWDGDGRADVIVGTASGVIALLRNTGGGRFAEAKPLEVPAVPYGAFVSVVDWNGDGDDDLLINTAYGYTCWFERSFLDGGYAAARR